MPKIKLRFAANNTFSSWIVRFLTRSKYSHVDYIFDDGSAYSSLPKTGVNVNDDKNDITVYCEIDVKSKEKLEWFLLEQKGKPYDWKAIIALPFFRNWQEDDAWFCSELISAAITYSNGKPLFNEKMWRITPRDLFLCPEVKQV